MFLSVVRRAEHNGAATAEMALAMPVLMMVLLGLIEFALFWHATNVVIGAAQDGARVAASEDATMNDGIQRAQQLMKTGLGNQLTDVTVSGQDGGDEVAIQVQGRFRLFIPWAVQGAIPIQKRAVISKDHFRAGPGHV